MLVDNKTLAGILCISPAAISKLTKKHKISCYRKGVKGRPRYILAEALADYDKNVNQGRSLREAAGKIDKWGQYANLDI